jgi:hypothetical protein
MSPEEILELKKIIVKNKWTYRYILTSLECSCRDKPILPGDWGTLLTEYKRVRNITNKKHYVVEILPWSSVGSGCWVSYDLNDNDHFREVKYFGTLKSIEHEVKLGDNLCEF